MSGPLTTIEPIMGPVVRRRFGVRSAPCRGRKPSLPCKDNQTGAK